MSDFVAGTPGSNSVTNVMASIFDLCIGTHCARRASWLISIGFEMEVVNAVLLHPVAMYFVIYQPHRLIPNVITRGSRTYSASLIP